MQIKTVQLVIKTLLPTFVHLAKTFVKFVSGYKFKMQVDI